jgi:polar amino acid transport system substrate-binding protein
MSWIRFLLGSLLLGIACISAPAIAEKPEITVGIGFTEQVNASSKSSSYHLDVLFTYRLFTELGYQVHFVIAPYAKLTQLLQQQQIDVATRQSGIAVPTLFYSSVYLEVNNRVFVRQDFAGDIRQIADLRHYPLVTFQNAKQVLGSEFMVASQLAPSYKEVFDHQQAVQMLLKGRTELLILNELTFYRRLAELNQPQSAIKSFDVLPKVQYRLAFSEAQLQTQVEQKLLDYLKHGSIKSIEQEALQQPEQIEKLLRRNR